MNDSWTSDTPPPPRPESRWRRLKRILIVGVFLVAGALGLASYLFFTPPAHWKEHQQFLASHTTQEIDQIADEVEQALMDVIDLDLSSELTHDSKTHPRLTDPVVSSSSLNKMDDTKLDLEGENQPEKIDPSMIRINETRKMVITDQQLNALVTARHKSWFKSRGYEKPNALTDIMLQLTAGELIAAFKVETAGFSQVFTGRFNLTFQEDGYATLNMTSFEAGRLPIPGGKVREYLADKAGQGSSTDKIGQWLSKLEEVRFKPVLDSLPHRRRARVQGYRILEEDKAKNQEKGVELTLQVQDFRTYAEMNKSLKEEFGSPESIQTAAVETGNFNEP